ncbi:MAG: CapA family protein [Eubacteriales bacterium]|nr:CapA family protein [Eubacteriales bacterium]
MKHRSYFCLACICILMLLQGCGQPGDSAQAVINEAPAAAQPASAETAVPSETAAPTPVPTVTQPQSVTLLFAGDVMAHQKQIDCHKFGSMYDFTDDYKYISGIISAADIAVANLETPMTGEPPYTGYPNFNAPDSLADALSLAGFDILAAANNHARDQLDEGIMQTNATLVAKGFTVIGTAAQDGGAKYALVEKNGINIGFVNFTALSNRGYKDTTEPILNCLQRGGGCDEGYTAMEGEIRALREQGAEFIVAFVHWGSEYQLENSAAQKDMAQRIADSGADLIIGAHPHVLQNVAEYASPVTGRETLIYYSLGNFVSNQPYSYGPGRGHCETGALALVKLIRADNGSVGIDSAGYLTTYVLKPNIVKEYTEDGEVHEKSTRAYYIVPAAAAEADPSSYEGAEGTLFRHIEIAADNGRKIIGESGDGLTFFDFQEYTGWPWEYVY